MQLVFVLSSDRQPLDPCHPARARKLLHARNAAIFRQFPFTIILKGRMATKSATHPHTLKLDPGSKTTGLAIVNQRQQVVWAGEVTHKGSLVTERLQSRSTQRRSRRNRKLRYRPARWANRRTPNGWLAPSLQSRIGNTETWVRRLRNLCPITAGALELVKFDTQKMERPEISGVEYEQGALAGYEVRAYLLEKWSRQCAYCGAKDTPLEIEHIVPKGRGGTDRVSNLALACGRCNQEKGNRTAAEFGHPDVQARAKQPLKDAAAMNATRTALYRRLISTGLSWECGTGGRTRYNRATLNLPKAHWIDAACVGESGGSVQVDLTMRPLYIKAIGRGTRQMCRTNAYGFPIAHRTRLKQFMGWQTGDLARAIVTSGKYRGTHIGRVSIRQRPRFRLDAAHSRIEVHPKYLERLQRTDGYRYAN